MKFPVLSILLVLSSLSSVNAQQEPLNQLDEKGRMTGKWIVYLDSNWNKTDSVKALYYRYTYYDHGTNLYPMGSAGGKYYTLLHDEIDEELPGPKLLEGEYQWYDKLGRLSSVHVFKGGKYISCKEYYRTGQLEQHFDYLEKYDDQPHSWCVYIYDKEGNLKIKSYFFKENGKWPITRG